MKVGDRVTWKSQSGGFTTTKTGEIVTVVPAGISPKTPVGFRCNSKFGYGMAREHESYLVRVDGKGNRLYWPLVRHLKLLRGDV